MSRAPLVGKDGRLTSATSDQSSYRKYALSWFNSVNTHSWEWAKGVSEPLNGVGKRSV